MDNLKVNTLLFLHSVVTIKNIFKETKSLRLNVGKLGEWMKREKEIKK